MAWWSRLFRGKARPELGAGENLLVISDVHLGEDILIDGSDDLAVYIRVINRELAGFVEAHRQHLVDDRRWHLVINGDLVDFVKVSLRPDPEEAFRLWTREKTPRRDERSVPNTAENVVWKLERIIEIHRPLFKELALFLLDGHRLTIVEGNHDAELYFEEVQQTVREALVRLAEQAHRAERRTGELDLTSLRGAIQFREWFEASAGRYHIEHGHQYDEYCSFEYQLAPLASLTSDRLAAPISSQAAPYFSKHAADITHHGLDDAGLWDMTRFMFSRGPTVAWELFLGYWTMIFSLAGRVGPRRRSEQRGLKERHERRLRELAEASPYGLSNLQRLDRLKATPAEYSRFKTFHGSYFDRFVIGGGALLGLLPALALDGMPALVWAGGVSLVALLAMVGAMKFGRFDQRGQLLRAAAGIAEITGARYVVFGHSHVAEKVNLHEALGQIQYGEVAHYFNTGSWVSREILLGAAGKGMTYVELSGEGGSLKRWRGREQPPEVLASTMASVPLPGLESAPKEEVDCRSENT